MTGGMVAMRLTAIPGASAVFRGGVVAYASEVKHGVIDVPRGPVVSLDAARAMAAGAARRLGADIGLATTGVAGPRPPGGARGREPSSSACIATARARPTRCASPATASGSGSMRSSPF